MMDTLASLYIHVPFCLHKCAYCDFHSVELGNTGEDEDLNPRLQQYVDDLVSDIRRQRLSPLNTIFFGGGTPSLLSGPQIQMILDTLRDHFQVDPRAEITLEANPETVAMATPGSFDTSTSSVQAQLRMTPPPTFSDTLTKMAQYRQAGVNRLSLGCQSFDNTVLKSLGRIHDAQANGDAYDTIRNAGFQNVNMDLIFAVPGQTLASWQQTLETAIQFNPEHIALYNLTEDHGRQPVLQDEELDLAMYRLARKLLTEQGYIHYEISNFAKPGYECRHNLAYWRNEPYLGLGEGAVSSSVVDDASMTVILGLRLLDEGVCPDRFRKRHGIDLRERFAQEIADLEKLRMLTMAPDSLRLTPRGLEVSNQIFEKFI